MQQLMEFAKGAVSGPFRRLMHTRRHNYSGVVVSRRERAGVSVTCL